MPRYVISVVGPSSFSLTLSESDETFTKSAVNQRKKIIEKGKFAMLTERQGDSIVFPRLANFCKREDFVHMKLLLKITNETGWNINMRGDIRKR